MLATRCPHCQTRFRVTPPQLELREGMVRCGACRESFNGREHLLHGAEDMPPEETLSAEDLEGRMTLVDFGSLRANQNQPTPPSNMQDELDALSKAISDLQSKPWSAPEEAELSTEAPPMMATPTPSFVEEATKREHLEMGALVRHTLSFSRSSRSARLFLPRRDCRALTRSGTLSARPVFTRWLPSSAA